MRGRFLSDTLLACDMVQHAVVAHLMETPDVYWPTYLPAQLELADLQIETERCDVKRPHRQGSQEEKFLVWEEGGQVRVSDHELAAFA